MGVSRDTIRVGLIGCNTRALWYGAIFGHIDARVYAELDPFGYHHMTFCQHAELQNRKARGFHLAKLHDSDPRAAEAASNAFRHKPLVCRSVEELVEDVDLVIIANAEGDGNSHVRLATPGLKRRIPTFIDRPFTRTTRQARILVALARRMRTPLLSCSHLRYLAHALRFKSRFQEIGPVDVGIVQGHGPNPALMADGVELALTLLGDDFQGRADSVQSMGQWANEIMHLHFQSPQSTRALEAIVVNSHTSMVPTAFCAQAVSKRQQVDSDAFDAFAQPEGGFALLQALQRMVRTGKTPLPYEAMIETVAVLEAGRRAYNKTHASRVVHRV